MYHSHAKKAIQEAPARTRRAIAAPEDQWNAKFVSFRTATIKNEPAIMSVDPTRSKLANERYDERVLKEGVCWSRPKCLGIAIATIRIATAQRGALLGG